MVTSEKTQANPRRHSKLNVLWQGPYEVTGGSPPKYQVRLLGEDAIATVHWRKMVRLAGAGYEPTAEVIASSMHDRQAFKVESIDDWMVDDDGDAEILIRWKYHSDTERTIF